MPAPRRTAGARGAQPGLPGPREPCGPPGARQLLPADRASSRSVAARVPGTPGPRALGSGRRPSLTAPGDARRGNLQPPGNLDLASPGDRSQPSFRRSQWTRAPAGFGTVQTPGDDRVRGFSVVPPAEPPSASPYLRKHSRGCQLILPLRLPPFFRSPPSISFLSSCQKLQGKDGHERTS